MPKLNYDVIQIGDTLPGFETAPISRLALALYCGASGDHNPIHVDSDYACRAGHVDVFAHGMLSMAHLGRLLTNWVPQEALREFGVRFVAVTHVHDRVCCSGTVVEKLWIDGERCLRLSVQAVDESGQIRLAGDAVVAF